MHRYRSHTCADLRAAHAGQDVRLAGWVHRVRDHGGLLFVDLRDHYGTTQVICDPDSPAFGEVERLRSEWCVRIDGLVKARDPSLVNAKRPTGEIEVFAREVEVLGPAGELPLPVFGDEDYPEETRLKYRFLDLRRESMQRKMTLRSDVVASLRRRMWDQGFREYQTPIITASSPEGARDFLVPSRLHPGKFYALPQAPQQFKQLLMVSGFDRYFQIAPCFRDEDPRADRSPTDFYQLDVEMSFVTQEDVFATIQPVIAGVFEEFGGGKAVDADWPRISYQDAALWYGTDKPDLRNPIRMQVVSEHFRGGGFAIFANLLKQEGTEVRAIPAPTGGSRKFADRMNAWAQKEGLPGMGYIFWRKKELASEERERFSREIETAMQQVFSVFDAPVTNEKTAAIAKFGRTRVGKSIIAETVGVSEAKSGNFSLLEGGKYSRVAKALWLAMNPIESPVDVPQMVEAAGPIAKALGPERCEALRRELDLIEGDAAFFLAGKPADFEKVAGRARTVIGEELGLTDKDRFAFAWIVDFPMYERTEAGSLDFSHNPFSMPQGGLDALAGDPLAVKAFQYDLACNGYELISGGIRNHTPEIMFRAFEIAGYPHAEVEKRFGGMLNAFRYGAPPHGGCAAGIDRIVMLLAGEENIREVILFPMNQRAEDVMMNAPSDPMPAQLRELGLRLVERG